MKHLAIAIICAISLSGCLQRIAINSLGGVMDDGFDVLNEEQDLDLARISIASDLELLKTILKSDPDNSRYLQLASMGYSSYSLGFVEDDSIEQARVLYLQGRDFGLRSLYHNEKFRNAHNGTIDEFRLALSSFSKDDVPAVFWTAIGWGSYISLSISDPAALADLPKVEAMMKWVLATDPSYFYGGAHFFLGTVYGTQPKPLGGNPDSSMSHFEECLKISGGKFLMAYVYYARSYAVQTQNRELFESCLTKVDTTSLDILPEARLSNAIAKKKAKILRARENELF